jgi:tryptophan synthase alpha chain
MIESYIKNRLKKKQILLMTHIVLGYPSFDHSLRIVEEMVAAGVDLMELQIPFSEPTADGPAIVRANQKALENGATVRRCLDFAEKASQTFNIPFLIMTYFNIIFKYGVKRFAAFAARSGLRGAIIPDLPPEEGPDYLSAMKVHDLAPILIFSPMSSPHRMRYIASHGRGFIYCVARKGVTGRNTDFSDGMAHYLAQCRESTTLPLALGFGIKKKQDIDFIAGKADIAVIGSQTIRVMEQKGITCLKEFIHGLR